MPDANAMDLTRFKLAVQKHERCCTQGLCFYCSLAGHIILFCPSKPSGEHTKAIQKALTAQPTQNASQDQEKA